MISVRVIGPDKHKPTVLSHFPGWGSSGVSDIEIVLVNRSYFCLFCETATHI